MKLSGEAAIGIVVVAMLGYYLYGEISDEFSSLANSFKDAFSGAGNSLSSAADNVSNAVDDAISLPGDLFDSLLGLGPGAATNEGDVLSNLGLQPGQTQVGVSNGGTW